MQLHNAERSRVRGKHINPHRRLSSKSLPAFRAGSPASGASTTPPPGPIFDERREKLEQFKPGASFDIIPGVGHWVQYEAPDEFNALLRARLKAQ